MTVEGRRSRATEAFFGRRKGRPMSPLQRVALEDGLRRYAVDLRAAAPADVRTLFERKVSQVRLEIGFGGGEHLLNEAAVHPDTGFIGVEPFVNSMAKLMGALAEAPLGNLRVHDDDATQLLTMTNRHSDLGHQIASHATRTPAELQIRSANLISLKFTIHF